MQVEKTIFGENACFLPSWELIFCCFIFYFYFFGKSRSNCFGLAANISLLNLLPNVKELTWIKIHAWKRSRDREENLKRPSHTSLLAGKVYLLTLSLFTFLVLFCFVVKEMFSCRAFLHNSDITQSSTLGTFLWLSQCFLCNLLLQV